jgi:hypothetical protein
MNSRQLRGDVRILDLLLARYCPSSFPHHTLRLAFLLLPLNCHPARRASGTEEILGKPVKMPSGDLYPSIDYWMPH